MSTNKINKIRINVEPILFTQLFEGIYENKYKYEIEYSKVLPRKDDYPEFRVLINWEKEFPDNVEIVEKAIKQLFKIKIDYFNLKNQLNKVKINQES